MVTVVSTTPQNRNISTFVAQWGAGQDAASLNQLKFLTRILLEWCSIAETQPAWHAEVDCKASSA